MRVKVNPGEMITPALLTYLILLVVVWYFWPENVETNPGEIIIFSVGVFVGAALVHVFYYLSFDEKQDEVDEFLTKSEIDINQKKSELKLHMGHLKDREDFLLEAIDRLNTESSEYTPSPESEEVKESEEESEVVKESEEESEEVKESEEESEEVEGPEEESEEMEGPEEEVAYESMTVVQLKEILKEKGMSASGKKNALVSRLRQ